MLLLLIAALSVIVPDWKQPRCPQWVSGYRGTAVSQKREHVTATHDSLGESLGECASEADPRRLHPACHRLNNILSMAEL